MESRNWWRPGHGDLHACLEQYALCADSSYHRIDAYGVKFPTTVVPLQAWLFRCISLGCDDIFCGALHMRRCCKSLHVDSDRIIMRA